LQAMIRLIDKRKPSLMRKIIVAVGLLALVASPLQASSDTKYKNISRQLVVKANVALRALEIDEARLLFERALVAYPANTNALLGLGRTHEAKGQVGRGLKYYRQALEIEPNDMGALEVQALAFLKREMLDRADANRAKLVRLCPNGCTALENVETALEAYLAEDKIAANAAIVMPTEAKENP